LGEIERGFFDRAKAADAQSFPADEESLHGGVRS
jgi:hypothetical protein